MIKIRLQRRGRRKRPIHHIVVADSRSPRDGRIIEDLGRFDNITPKNEVDLNEERAIHWLKQGAQPSDTVRSILKNQGIMYKMHLIRWGKSEEEIEKALAEWREKRAEKEDTTPSRKEKQQAMLEAEEKEYQKQLKKKAEEAAKEKAKQKALAKAEEEESEEDTAEESEEAVETAEEQAEETEEVAAKDSEEEIEGESDDEASDVEEPDEDEQKQEAADDVEADEDEEDSSEDEETEVKSEAEEEPTEEEVVDTSDEGSEAKTSTDMLAKEAIEHIENTPLDELDGFVTDDEDRVTVQRAWEEKQEG